MNEDDQKPTTEDDDRDHALNENEKLIRAYNQARHNQHYGRAAFDGDDPGLKDQAFIHEIQGILDRGGTLTEEQELRLRTLEKDIQAKEDKPDPTDESLTKSPAQQTIDNYIKKVDPELLKRALAESKFDSIDQIDSIPKVTELRAIVNKLNKEQK